MKTRIRKLNLSPIQICIPLILSLLGFLQWTHFSTYTLATTALGCPESLTVSPIHLIKKWFPMNEKDKARDFSQILPLQWDICHEI